MKLRRRLARALGAAVALYLVAAGAIVWAGLRDARALADVIVVLGTTVHEDGSLSMRLQARLDAALSLYRARLARVILVSGGLGREGHDEAVAMATYLLKQGVPEAAIVLDSQGDTTALTAAHTASHLRARGLHSVLIATQYFHVPRTRLLLERQGVRVAGSAHARFFELRDFYSIAREVVAYASYWIR